MSQRDSSWGIILPMTTVDEKVDPIKELIKEQEKIKAEVWDGVNLAEFKENKQKRLQEKEKEIWDAINFKNMKVSP